MPLQKTITTPAGNVLGTYGVVTQVNILATAKGLTAIGCALQLYASATASTQQFPPVATYRYGLGGASVQPGDNFIADAEQGLLKIADSGTFVTADVNNPQARSTWVPGWTGGVVVAASTGPTGTTGPAAI